MGLIMGAHRRSIEQSKTGQLSGKDKERADWIDKQRGVKSNRMAGQAFAGRGGGIFGMMNFMTAGAKPFRDKETRDWIDQQRGVKSDPREGQGGAWNKVLRFNEQKKGERDAWIDEQIKKGREKDKMNEIINKAKSFKPMSRQERRSYLNKEVESRKDIWDDRKEDDTKPQFFVGGG